MSLMVVLVVPLLVAFDKGIFEVKAVVGKSQSMSDLCRLRTKCERTKHILSKYELIHDTDKKNFNKTTCSLCMTIQFFTSKAIQKVVNDTKIIKNQAAVYSAAAQAAILSGDTSKKIKDILIRDDCFTFLPFNVVTSGGVITPFIERNTVIRDGNGRVMVGYNRL
ncbi:hypothetical protein RhiirA1_477577 [Rhizophagus irregularis]|uniref:Uncharacterized protein n=1 Tax=Rhizophagus irregularis TaxID=588596 RepID=A0A2N0QTA7_9GLOM|nr:hypothetical protein RhiirA1_477577 [Rhizophagus irregularis]